VADLLGEPLPDIPIPEGEEALGTLLDALGRGEAEALFTLGMLCLRGEAGGILSRIDRGKLSGREQKGPVARGFEFLADAADAGHVGASYWAGALLQERNGLEVWGSVREARRYLKQAAGKRYGRAEERLGMPFAPPLLRPPFRKGVHGFDPLAFRRLRRPWLWAGLAPSLLLDGLFLAIAVHDRHVGETWATVGTLTVLAMILNALLFKAWPLHAYRRLQRLREGGEVRVGKEVSFLVLDWRQPEAGEGAVRYTLWRVLSVRRGAPLPGAFGFSPSGFPGTIMCPGGTAV